MAAEMNEYLSHEPSVSDSEDTAPEEGPSLGGTGERGGVSTFYFYKYEKLKGRRVRGDAGEGTVVGYTSDCLTVRYDDDDSEELFFSVNELAKLLLPVRKGPDLSGLWESRTIGGERRWWSKPAGGAVLLLFVLCWVGGLLCPLWILALAYCQCYTWLAVLGAAVAWQYVLPVERWPAAMRFWMLACHYFEEGCSMSWEAERIPNDVSEPTLLCYHPHGIFSLGVLLNGVMRYHCGEDPACRNWDVYCGSKLGPFGSKALVSSVLASAPIFGHVIGKWSGGLHSASKDSMRRLMEAGDTAALVPGGFNEAAHFVRNRERVYVRKRKGMIKYALEYGYRVVPAYTFNESHSFSNLPGFYLLREVVSQWGLPTVVPMGVWWCPLLPYGDKGVHTIHGPALRLPRIAHPTAEEVDKYHEQYVQALQRLFDAHKWRFGQSEVELEIL